MARGSGFARFAVSEHGDRVNQRSTPGREPPSGSRKNGPKTFADLPRHSLDGPAVQDLTRGLYTFSDGPLTYDFIYSPSSESRLFVLLAGSSDRKKYQAPLFQRWLWADAFPGHCLCIADPSLRLNSKLNLAWYFGVGDRPTIPTIATLVRNVASSLGIAANDVFAYASSGGAFAALQLALLLPEMTTVAINPQTDVTRYEYMPARFPSVCLLEEDLEVARARYGSRLSLVKVADQLATRRILYLQNRADKHHMRVHFAPLWSAMGMGSLEESKGHVVPLLFDHPGGHGAAEPRERFPEFIARAIELSRAG